jgi:hypothetical protein
MTARIVVPVIPDLLKDLFDRTPGLKSPQGDVLARDPRFAIRIYRAAVATGVMDSVRLMR